MKRNTIDDIKNYLKANHIDCTLLSTEYHGNREKLLWKCACGNTFEQSLATMYHSNHMCSECTKNHRIDAQTYSIEDIKKMIADKPYTMIDETFTMLSNGFDALTPEGYTVRITRNAILKNQQPEIFHVDNPHTISNIKHYLHLHNIATTLLSNSYRGNAQPLEWKCACGKIFKRAWNNFQHSNGMCRECAVKQAKSKKCQAEFENLKHYFTNKDCCLVSKEYTGHKNKIAFVCNKHKDKGVQYINWMKCKHNNAGCKYCSREQQTIKSRTSEADIKVLTESKGFIYDHIEYLHGKTIVYFYCKTHFDKGLQTKTLPDMKKSSGKCTFCFGRDRTHPEFVDLVASISQDIEILSTYINVASIIKCRCKICGNQWSNSARNLIKGQGCRVCASKKNGEKCTKNHITFLQEIATRYDGNIQILSQYTGSHESITCYCVKHKTSWVTTPTSLLSNTYGCPICAKEAIGDSCKKTNEQFLSELSQVNPTIVPLEEYKGNQEKIRCLCTIHNYEWNVEPNKILYRRTGCPKCASYHNENVLDSILDKYGYKYSIQKRFENCKDKKSLPFDRYLDDFGILIEYDGEGHYIPIKRGHMTDEEAMQQLQYVQRHDKIKNQYCKDNNIPLIRIPYWERNNMEQYLLQQLSMYNIGETTINN